MTSEFDREISLRPDGAGWAGTFGDGWRIGGGINGGLLLAAVALGLRKTIGDPHPDPLAISATYLSPTGPGTFVVRPDVVRRGRVTATAQASLLQVLDTGAEVERIRALATYGDLGSVSTDVRVMSRPPGMPPPEKCVTVADAPADFLEHSSLLQRLDLRLDPACAGWVLGQPAGRGEFRAWLRLPDGREPDPLTLLLAIDALPPVTFDFGLYGWAPTVALTAYLRGRPAPGWLRVRTVSRNLFGGSLEEDGEVWDSTGRLVAQSRQLAFSPRG
ncbi:MAG: thioesterase family protein [Nocardioidaceae bacterium]